MTENAQPQRFGAFLKGWFKSLWQMVKNPLAFLPTILIAGVWIVLGIVQARHGEEPWLAWLNFFTFAQGGLFGGVTGAVGGILGKILVAALINALLLPLFLRKNKPQNRFGKGFGGFFRSFAFDGLRALSTFFMGMAIALALYSFFNITQRWQEGLVGIAGAVMLIRSIGQKGGFLFSLAFSLSSAFTGKKGPSQEGITRFLSGMTIGFVAGTGMNAFGVRWAVLIAVGSLALALLFFIFGKRRMAAFATACVAAMLFIPLHAGIPQSQEDRKRASMKYADELAPYVAEINKCIKDVQEIGDDASQKRLEAAQKKYNDALNDYARNGSTAQKPQEQSGKQTSVTEARAITDDDTDVSPKKDEKKEKDKKSDTDYDNDDEYEDEDEDEDDEDYGDFYDEAERIATEGWADEDSYVDDEDEVTLLEGIAGASAIGGAAGAAAGAAGGGAGGPLGGGEMPDFPEGTPAKRKEGEGEDDGDEPREGGGPDPLKNRYVSDNGDGSITMTSPSTGEKILLVSDGEGGWKNPLTDVKYDNQDIHNWINDQQENDSYYKNKAAADDRYKQAFEKDAKDWASHSDEERIASEVEEEERMREWEENEERRHQNVLDAAARHGIATHDAEGNERNFADIYNETQVAIKKGIIRANYLDELAIQQICSEVELECSEQIAKYELVDKVAEDTIFVLAEVLPEDSGAKLVKDGHTFLKSVAVSGMEAYVDGRSVKQGMAGGSIKGLMGVIQNHSSDYANNAGLKGPTKFLYVGAINVMAEGNKELYDGIIKGKSLPEVTENIQKAMYRKTGEHLVNSGLGALGMSDTAANLTTGMIMRGHDELKFGKGDDAKTLSETITDKINGAKNSAVGTIMYKTGFY